MQKGPQIDLTLNGGASSTTVAPSPAQQPFKWLMPAPKASVNGNYPLATDLVIAALFTFNQAASGGTAYFWDQLARVMSSLRGYCPEMGVTHAPEVFTGPVAKHVVEPFMHDFGYYGGVIAQIVATDGDTVVPYFYTLPFAQQSFVNPLDFAMWTGMLHDFELTTTVAPNTVFGTTSNPPTVDSMTLSAWFETTPKRKLVFPTIAQWNVYTPTAANGQLLLNSVGQTFGLTCVEPGSRLACVLEIMNPTGAGGTNTLGLGGPTTADTFSSFACDQLNQPVTVNVQAFPAFIVQERKRAQWGQGAANVNTNPNAGWPYSLAATPLVGTATHTTFMDPGLMFIPWKAHGRNAEIGEQMKFSGNLTLNRVTSSAGTGNAPVVTEELRQITQAFANRMVTLANLSPSQVAEMRIDSVSGGGDPLSNPKSGQAFALPRVAGALSRG